MFGIQRNSLTDVAREPLADFSSWLELIVRMQSVYLLLVSLLFLVPVVEAASPCRDDVVQYCGEVERGEGRVASCIAENQDKFSAECQASMRKAREDVEALMVACKDDRERYCSGVKPGRGQILRCMREHRDELSAACRDEADRVRAEWKVK